MEVIEGGNEDQGSRGSSASRRALAAAELKLHEALQTAAKRGFPITDAMLEDHRIKAILNAVIEDFLDGKGSDTWNNFHAEIWENYAENLPGWIDRAIEEGRRQELEANAALAARTNKNGLRG